MLLSVVCSLLLATDSIADSIQHQHLEAQLVSEYEQLLPGQDASFALRLVPKNGWHVYWKYPGDTGAAPILSWWVNGQSVAADLHWPVPERIPIGPFVNYGYRSEVYLIATLPIPDSAIPDSASDHIEIKLDAEWLVCKEECIPGNAIFSETYDFTGGDDLLPTEFKKRFDHFRALVPATGSTPSPSVSQTADTIALTFNVAHSAGGTLNFFPEIGGIVSNPATQTLETGQNSQTLRLKKDANFKAPTTLSGVLVKSPPWSDGSIARAIEINIPTLSTARVLANHSGGLKQVSKTPLLSALLLAFLGGLILNLMPCVFPVLSIKILSFVKKAGKDPAKIRVHGLLFASGILVSFWTLALLVRSLHLAGDGLGWGFQLQNPQFVALLVLLLVAVAMNLFGVFELGSSLQRLGARANLQSEGYAASFGSGILATVLATPCTAPFMGAALAYAIVSSFWVSMLVFTALALGLATPYLLLSYFPGWLAKLPRPGEWMITFRQLMGFPILATALWLAWVYEQQSDEDRIITLLAAAFLLTLVLWIYGKATRPTRPRSVRLLGATIGIVGILASISVAMPYCCKGTAASSATQSVSTDANVEIDAYGLPWHTYSEQTVNDLIQAGNPVFIDFTAAWCVTCQLNKKVVFGSQAVRKELTDRGVALVRADWTNRDTKIKSALAEFGKVGVPLNVLYSPHNPGDPVVFPSLLTPTIVLSALQDLN